MILWAGDFPLCTSIDEVLKGDPQAYLDKLNRRGDGRTYRYTDDCPRCLGVFCESSERRLDFCRNLG